MGGGNYLGMGRYQKVLNNEDRREVDTAIGDTDIDISAAVYTAFVTLLTVTAPTGGINDLVIDLDFDKATTGINEVATNADTLDAQLQVSADGTNFVGVENITQVTLTGTAGSIATGVNGHRFKVGSLYTGGVVKVLVKLSAERADAEVPYRVTYSALGTPTITAVAAG